MVRGDVQGRQKRQLNLPQFTTQTCGPCVGNFFLLRRFTIQVENQIKGGKVKNNKKKKHESSPERFELSRGNPMYLAGTRLNHSAKATTCSTSFSYFNYYSTIQNKKE